MSELFFLTGTNFGDAKDCKVMPDTALTGTAVSDVYHVSI